MNRMDMKKEIEVPPSKGKIPVPPSNMREAADPVDPSAVSEDMMETGPTRDVRKGKPEPKPDSPMPMRNHGSIVGSGEESEMGGENATTMSSSSGGKDPMMGGSHMGHKGVKPKMTGGTSF
jgi:hypothetical protein